MSTYSQSEVVRIVESVLPEIVKSGDPHSALIKRATELNLPPSVLEKAGQAFNTAKTLNYLERVADLEKRGSTFKTLDVQALVDDYTEYKPNESLWAAALSKSASVDDIDTEDSYIVPKDFNPLEVVKDTEVYKEASETSKVILEDPDAEKKLTMRKAAEANVRKRNIETLRVIREKAATALRAKVASLVSHYDGMYVDAPAMDTLEAEASRIFDSELVKQAFDLVQSTMERRSILKPRVKRASAESKTRTLIKRSTYHDAVKDVIDAYLHEKAATAVLEEEIELTKEAADVEEGKKKHGILKLETGRIEDHSAELAAAEAQAQADRQAQADADAQAQAQAQAEKEKKEKADADAQAQAQADADAQAQAQAQAEKEKKEKADADAQAQAQAEKEKKEKADAEAAEYEAEMEATQKEIDDQAAQTKADEDEKAKLRKEQEEKAKKGPLHDITTGRAILDGARKAKEHYKPYLDSYAEGLRNKTKEKQEEIDTAAVYARGEAALNTLLLTDPVISEYDEESMRDVFFTILRVNPDVATDINLLRSVLRQAGQFEGVDLETAKTLNSLNRKSKKDDDDDDDNKKD